MKKGMQWLAMLAGLCLTVACSSDDDIKPNEDNSNLVHITFTAGHNSTRTAIDASDSKQIDWQEGETLSILDGSSTTRTFTLTSGAGKMEGTFDGMAQEANVYTAVYPQQADLTLKGNSVEGMVLDSVQTATEGTFDPKANLMMARTSEGDRNLQFHNATAFIKVTPTMDCEQISIVNADSTQALAGTMAVTLDDKNAISTEITAGGTHMVSLMGDIKAGKTYYIAVAPGTLKNGFRLGFTTTEGKHYYKDASKSVTLTPNKVLNLGKISVEEEDKNWLPYVTFSADAEQGVTLKESQDMVKGSQVIEKMWYSVDYGKHWAKFNVNKEYSFGKDKRLMLKGKNEYGTSAVNVKDGYNYFEFKSASTSTSCSGDIRSLVNEDKVEEANTTNARFYGLFTNCGNLTSAPELPSTELANNCYEYMFHYCYMLKEAPALPATTLKDNCYGYMFSGCMSLEKAPVLPAETLVSHCYFGMFGSCYQLKNVTMLAKDVSAKNCLDTWLGDTYKGTVYVAKDTSDESLNTIKSKSNGWDVVRQQ